MSINNLIAAVNSLQSNRLFAKGSAPDQFTFADAVFDIGRITNSVNKDKSDPKKGQWEVPIMYTNLNLDLTLTDKGDSWQLDASIAQGNGDPFEKSWTAPATAHGHDDLLNDLQKWLNVYMVDLQKKMNGLQKLIQKLD